MRRIRIFIFMIVVTLICMGVVMVYSSSAIFSYERYGKTAFLLQQHLFHILVGVILTVLVMSQDIFVIRRWAKGLFILSLILLVLVFVPNLAKVAGGARRWLKLGTLSFQPSEFVKWTTVLFLADILASGGAKKENFRGTFLLAVASGATACALILGQPDLGQALALGTVVILLLFVAGVRLSYIVGLVLLSLPVLYFSIFSVPYRQKRIFAFLNPWADARGYGFQMVQSYLALGLGGLAGVGLGRSTQKLFYLPAAHTDFIFAIIGEELGLLGTASIVLLFMLFLWQGIKISLHSTDSFIQLLSFGIVVTVVLHAFVHIAVACGAVPTKGLPLPFISYGGSSLVFNMMAVGLLLNLARDRYFKESSEKVFYAQDEHRLEAPR